MRGPVRLLPALAFLFGSASCMLVAACSGGSVQVSDVPGSVSVQPSDDPAGRVRPTWNLPAPTALPSPTPTPVA